jgi:general secretion pathway protein G
MNHTALHHRRASASTSRIVTALRQGFTLMEMMLVLAIIAILIGIGASMLGGADENAKIVAARANISTVKSAILMYKAMNGGRAPSQQQGLEVLVNGGKNGRSCINPEGIIDPWGKTYKFRNPGNKSRDGFDIYSLGPDGVEGNADDVGNWAEAP